LWTNPRQGQISKARYRLFEYSELMMLGGKFDMGASSFKISFNLDEMRKKLRADVVARTTQDAAKGKVGF
jgi:hypothetical protein